MSFISTVYVRYDLNLDILVVCCDFHAVKLGHLENQVVTQPLGLAVIHEDGTFWLA